jgi:acylphosphatase
MSQTDSHETQARAHLHISGKVQGVFFRDTTRKEARSRDITGWVRNLSDGRVEAIFEGPRADIEEMVEFCHQGPPRADVDSVEVEWEEPTGSFDSFEVRR